MLFDNKIKSLQPQDKQNKVQDRDGMYLVVSIKCTKTFRFNYRYNGRQQTLTIGKYGKN